METAIRTSVRPRQTVPEVREVAVSSASHEGRSLHEMKLSETFGITVLSIKKSSGASLTNPPPDTILHHNDRLRVLGRSDEIDRFASYLSAEYGP
jgi:Trk K+ transport system NAD-binding subunit